MATMPSDEMGAFARMRPVQPLRSLMPIVGSHLFGISTSATARENKPEPFHRRFIGQGDDPGSWARLRPCRARQGYATMKAIAVSGAGIAGQKRRHATSTYQWPGVPSPTETSPDRPVLGRPTAGARWRACPTSTRPR
jgi:hypothetical protein